MNCAFRRLTNLRKQQLSPSVNAVQDDVTRQISDVTDDDDDDETAENDTKLSRTSCRDPSDQEHCFSDNDLDASVTSSFPAGINQIIYVLKRVCVCDRVCVSFV
jgi:hypothetical protein